MKWLRDIYGKYITRKIALLFLPVLIVFHSGCATHYTEPSPSEEVRASLGTIGVISSRSLPDFYYRTPSTEEKMAGTLKGAGRGAFAPMKTLCIPGGQEVGAFICAVGIALAPVGAIVGGVHGAVTAVPEKDAKDAQKSLDTALNTFGIQQAMRDRFITIARQKTARQIVDINKIMFPAGYQAKSIVDEGELIKASRLKEAGFDSVIIYEAAQVNLDHLNSKDNPPLLFSINAVLRIRSSDGTLLYTTYFDCNGEEHRFTKWAANDSSLFKEAVERSYDDIAKQAVDRLFILKTTAPEDQNK